MLLATASFQAKRKERENLRAPVLSDWTELSMNSKTGRSEEKEVFLFQDTVTPVIPAGAWAGMVPDAPARVLKWHLNASKLKTRFLSIALAWEKSKIRRTFCGPYTCPWSMAHTYFRWVWMFCTFGTWSRAVPVAPHSKQPAWLLVSSQKRNADCLPIKLGRREMLHIFIARRPFDWRWAPVPIGLC